MPQFLVFSTKIDNEEFSLGEDSGTSWTFRNEINANSRKEAVAKVAEADAKTLPAGSSVHYSAAKKSEWEEFPYEFRVTPHYLVDHAADIVARRVFINGDPDKDRVSADA